MADIRPFRGVRYNQQKNDDISRLICPPYDIIDKRRQDELYRRSEYNFVRIEYNRERPEDTPQDNRYSRAASLIKQWMKEGVLFMESEPALYIHQQEFRLPGKTLKRKNLITLVKIEDWAKNIIRPHENIIPRAKSDRMSMLRSCGANTSPVLAIYEDQDRSISALIESAGEGTPLIEAPGDNGEYHLVQAVKQPEIVSKIQSEFDSRPLYIADGHHRYDSSLTFMKEQSGDAGSEGGEDGSGFVMMSLVNIADPGLIILPSHRLVKGIPGYTLEGLEMALGDFFDIQELPVDDPGLYVKLDSILSGIGPDTQATRMAVYGLDRNRMQVLTLKDYDMAARMMPPGHGEIYKKMDVSLVDHVILEKLLNYRRDSEDIMVEYCDKREEAVERVRDGSFQLVFILNPKKPGLIKSIADAGDRMPRKSTYFYPKAPAGLVFYKW
ncbi:MAG: DUF1015 domain-containing protein [Dehalococcoidales bacterium]|nr:DUF1015 domain-containing protein [Dehalococcoidales bacterium]